VGKDEPGFRELLSKVSLGPEGFPLVGEHGEEARSASGEEGQEWVGTGQGPPDPPEEREGLEDHLLEFVLGMNRHLLPTPDPLQGVEAGRSLRGGPPPHPGEESVCFRSWHAQGRDGEEEGRPW